MSKFAKKDRQRIIDDYLAATGKNLFVPAEFIDWLADNPEHEAYEWFYGMGDEAAAREYRVHLARQMANGLRLVATVSEAPSSAREVSVKTQEYPAYISPVGGRKSGGGYVSFDPEDRDALDELCRQGASALRSWLRRYASAYEKRGIDVSTIDKIASAIDGDREE